MSTPSPFANPATGATDNAAAYVAALLDLLAGQEPILVQRELMGALQELTRDVTDTQLRQPEKPGKWSVLQVIQHLAQTELVIAYRYRVVLAQDDPEIPGFDQDQWVNRLASDTETSDSALTRIRYLRGWNLEFLEKLTPDQWSRSGRHAERGVESIRRIADLAAAHDLVHRAQIQRILKGVS